MTSRLAGQTAANARLGHLDRLESVSIQIIRETAAVFQNPVLPYSVGRDSSVLLDLAQKAFAPRKPPFPMLHADTAAQPRRLLNEGAPYRQNSAPFLTTVTKYGHESVNLSILQA